MSTDTPSHSMYDSDELKWTCKCGQIFDLYEAEPSTTTRYHDWQTQFSDSEYERDYTLYSLNLLVGVFCLMVVIILLRELYLDIKFFLS